MITNHKETRMTETAEDKGDGLSLMNLKSHKVP